MNSFGGQKQSSIPAVDAVTRELAKLPGIGPRMAQRLTFALLKRDPKDNQALIKTLESLSQDVLRCSQCGFYAQSDPCTLCQGQGRDTHTLCVVEQPQDLMAIERTGKFNGMYHVLGGALSPIDGIGPDELGIPKLINRIKNSITEVILATNPTMEGDATAHYLQSVIKPMNVRITRIARGLPSGSDLEYADETTLSMALTSRSEI